MVTVTLPENTRTRRLWNETIAQYYEYQDRPEFSERDDGLYATRMKRECAEELADAGLVTIVDEDAETEATDADGE